MKSPWIETERQGPGRRYWFRTRQDALRFYEARHDGVAVAFTDGPTVWLSYAKRGWTSSALERVANGIDPLAVGGGR